MIVDPQRYLGRWYEYARYDNSFQKGCSFVTADYQAIDADTIAVTNQCIRHLKEKPVTSVAHGTAHFTDHEQKAKLKVTFFWPFYGDYWVLDHDEGYTWSIVGEPSGRYLWLLFRTPQPDEAVVHQVMQRITSMGYDTAALEVTVQYDVH